MVLIVSMFYITPQMVLELPTIQHAYAAGPLTPTKTVYVSNYTGSNLGIKINNANTDCGPVVCEIVVNMAGQVNTAFTLSVDRKLTFQAFTYVIGAQMALNDRTEVAGAGVSSTILVRNATYFAGKGADLRTIPPGDFNNLATAFLIYGNNNKSHIYIHDIMIDGNTDAIGYYPITGRNAELQPVGKIFNYPKGNSAEIRIFQGSDIWIDHVKVTNAANFAIGVSGNSTTHASNVIISNNDLSATRWDAHQIIWMSQVDDITISNNYIHGGGHEGLYMAFATDVAINNNNFDSNRQETYWTGTGGQIDLAQNTSNISVTNNIINNAMYIPTCQLTDNDQHPLVGYGLEIHGYYVTVSGNTIMNNAGEGIEISDNSAFGLPDPHDITITGNTVIANGYPLQNIVNTNYPNIPRKQIAIDTLGLITNFVVTNNILQD